jgi:single-stranded-DNA-specific exonuclease
MVRHFEPFGIGNAAPLLVSRGVRIDGVPRVLGQQGLKLRFAAGQAALEGVWWGVADRAGEFEHRSLVDIAYRLERDTYFEAARTVARLIDIRRDPSLTQS